MLAPSRGFLDNGGCVAARSPTWAGISTVKPHRGIQEKCDHRAGILPMAATIGRRCACSCPSYAPTPKQVHGNRSRLPPHKHPRTPRKPENHAAMSGGLNFAPTGPWPCRGSSRFDGSSACPASLSMTAPQGDDESIPNLGAAEVSKGQKSEVKGTKGLRIMGLFLKSTGQPPFFCWRTNMSQLPIEYATCIKNASGLFYGGGGDRTRVPRHFHISLYVRSRTYFRLRLTAPRPTGCRSTSRQQFLIPGVPNIDPRRAGICDQQSDLSGENPQPGLPIARQPVRDDSRQLNFGRLFTWPADQPRHATWTSSCPVESNSPPKTHTLTIAARRSSGNTLHRNHENQARKKGFAVIAGMV